MLDGNETSDQKPDGKSFEELGQVDCSHAKNNNLGKAWWMGSRVLWP